MPTLSIREQVLAAFHTQLATIGGDVTVERNSDDAKARSKLPTVVQIDGGHRRETAASGDGEVFGQDTYNLRTSVAGYLDAVDDASLGTGLSDLYARIVKTMLAATTLGGKCQYLQEAADALDDPDWDHVKGRRPNAAILVHFDIEFVTKSGDPYAPP